MRSSTSSTIVVLAVICLYKHTFAHTDDSRTHDDDEFRYELHARTRRENTVYRARNPLNENLKSVGNETNCHGGKKSENCTLTQNYTDANHRYYLSRYYPQGNWLFVDLSKSHPKDMKVEKHEKLSNSYKKAFRIPIDFHFPFYGNFVDRIVVTTGGFINIGPQFHSFVHRVHYIAPLMADFNPMTNNKSIVYIGKSPNLVIVQWNDFLLNGKENAGKTFTFQVSLHKNGTIVLAYKNIPIPPANIRVPRGDVGVIAGFSDGFIITYKRHEKYKLIVHNLIYSYHKVDLPLKKIMKGAAYRLTLLPNCIQFKTCSGCLSESKRLTNFTCRWCAKLNQCSDALDWNRQNWLTYCVRSAYSDASKCSSSSKSESIIQKLKKKKHSGSEGSEGDSTTTVGIVIGMLLFVLLVIVGGVFTYAYTHPLSKPGIFLIENRRPWKKFQNNNTEEDYAQLCTPTVT